MKGTEYKMLIRLRNRSTVHSDVKLCARALSIMQDRRKELLERLSFCDSLKSIKRVFLGMLLDIVSSQKSTIQSPNYQCLNNEANLINELEEIGWHRIVSVSNQRDSIVVRGSWNYREAIVKLSKDYSANSVLISWNEWSTSISSSSFGKAVQYWDDRAARAKLQWDELYNLSLKYPACKLTENSLHIALEDGSVCQVYIDLMADSVLTSSSLPISPLTMDTIECHISKQIKECSICSEFWSGTDIPSVHCTSCDLTLHRECCLEWLQNEPEIRRIFNKIVFPCPTCSSFIEILR